MLDKPADTSMDQSPSKLKDFGFNLDTAENIKENGNSDKSKSISESKMLDGDVDLLHDDVMERPSSRRSRTSMEAG